MPQTPDRWPGPLYEEAIYLEDTAVSPSAVGEIRRSGSDILAFDSAGLFNLRQSSGSDLLTRAVFKADGGIIYTGSGAAVIKENI